MFDEPSSYLDVKQRLRAAATIRDVLTASEASRGYVLVVEHDLAVLDYLSDYICCLYGTPRWVFLHLFAPCVCVFLSCARVHWPCSTTSPTTSAASTAHPGG
jgi:hypothetical protein